MARELGYAELVGAASGPRVDRRGGPGRPRRSGVGLPLQLPLAIRADHAGRAAGLFRATDLFAPAGTSVIESATWDLPDSRAIDRHCRMQYINRGLQYEARRQTPLSPRSGRYAARSGPRNDAAGNRSRH